MGLLCTWGLALLLTELDWVDSSWLTVPNVVGLFLLVALARWVIVSRRRLVIGNFVDYSGKEPQRLPGLSTLLQVELIRLYDLLDVVDGRRAAPEVVEGPQNVSFDEQRKLEEADVDRNQVTAQPLDVPAPIMAEDLSGVLEAAVSVEATMALGPVKVPIGALASLVGRLAQGPRLTGAVHRTPAAVVVTARTVGHARHRTWRVDGAPSSDGKDGPSPEALLEELAIRILTDLALEGLVRWKATASYVDGLRWYRECLRTKKDRRLNLERAKESFIETIARDDRFDLAHYNLGVVATELGQREAAEAAFLSAIRINRDRWAPYYGLAQLYFVEERYEDVLPLCSRIIRLRRHRAEAYHLRAMSLRHKGYRSEAMLDRRRSVRWAWARMCGAALRGDDKDTRKLAATTLRNLAGIRAYDAKDRWPVKPKPGPKERERRPIRLRIGYLAACCELRQGRYLDRADAEMHFELGKVYAARRKWGAAAEQLERAVEIVPDRPRFWIQLARAYAGPDPTRASQALRDRAAFASDRAMAQPSEIVEGGFQRLQTVYTRIGRCQQAVRSAQLEQFEREREKWRADVPPNVELEAMLDRLDEQELWEATQVCVQLGQRYLRCADTEHVQRVADRLVKELGNLCKKHPREVRRHGIYALTAEVLHAAERKTDALRYAEAAVVHDPLSKPARRVLAQLYLDLGHLEQAREAWCAALVADPDGPSTNFGMGQCLVRLALDTHDPQRRSGLLCEATRYLRNALKLYQLGPADGEGDGDDAVVPSDIEGQVRFWLGRAFFELDDYEQAVTQFQLCVTLDFQPLLSRLRLGVAHLRLGHVCSGERILEEVCSECSPESASPDAGSVNLGPPGDALSRRDIVAWARIYVAGSHIDRDAAIPDAVETIQAVRAQVEEHQHADSRAGMLAACADWEGWAKFQEGDSDGAIKCLGLSVTLQPTAEAYAHLARVHADLALREDDRRRQHRDIDRARHYAALARRIGLGLQQDAPLEESLRRLELASSAV